MTMRSRRLTGVALLGAAALALSGCGDNGNGNGTTGGATDGESPQAAGTPCEQAQSSALGLAMVKVASKTQAEGTGEALHIGSLLPQTGNLAFLGPPEFAGVELAIQEINEAGGVNGQDVQYTEGDSGDAQQDVANPTVDRLLAAGVNVIIGAASSGVSFTVIDKITAAGVVMYSPANTSPDFTDYDDNGLYFRTAPSDVLQGRILGETIVGDGHTSVGILALQDPYGEGLARNVSLAVEEGGAELAPASTVFYDPAASNFDAQVGQIRAADPDAIVLIGFDESARVIQSMVSQGIGPQEKQLYLVDGNTGNALGEDLPAGVLEGVKGSIPGAEATAEFRSRLCDIDSSLTDFSYSAESYDAVITSALAAVAAGSVEGVDIARELPGVTRSPGTECEDFAECRDLLEDGEEINYQGRSGPIELSDRGDPTQASVGIYTYGEDNTLTDDIDYQEGSLDDE